MGSGGIEWNTCMDVFLRGGMYECSTEGLVGNIQNGELALLAGVGGVGG